MLVLRVTQYGLIHAATQPGLVGAPVFAVFANRTLPLVARALARVAGPGVDAWVDGDDVEVLEPATGDAVPVRVCVRMVHDDDFAIAIVPALPCRDGDDELAPEDEAVPARGRAASLTSSCGGLIPDDDDDDDDDAHTVSSDDEEARFEVSDTSMIVPSSRASAAVAMHPWAKEAEPQVWQPIPRRMARTMTAIW